MKKIIIGEKDDTKEYSFRETCFGIVVKDNLLYCNEKNEEISLIGGGLEDNESYLDCLKREFLEEAGLFVESAKPLCIIDCFWITKDKKNMESLANIYIVEISDKFVKPLEKDCKIKRIKLNDALNALPLPYHKKALEEYISYICI